MWYVAPVISPALNQFIYSKQYVWSYQQSNSLPEKPAKAFKKNLFDDIIFITAREKGEGQSDSEMDDDSVIPNTTWRVCELRSKGLIKRMIPSLEKFFCYWMQESNRYIITPKTTINEAMEPNQK